MSRIRKDPLYRAASHIQRKLTHSAAAGTNAPDRQLSRLADACCAICHCHQRLATARFRGWRLAAQSLHRRLLDDIASLHASTEELLRDQSPLPVAADISVPLILAELRQLHDEFPTVQIDLEEDKNVITVKTESIVLEEMNLGPFSIELHIDRLAERIDSSCFCCVALDPHPASSNELVTHPHVNDQGLCAGDALFSINAALQEGRLCDAFVLVNSVLHAYNPGSAYVRLEDWEGASCPDCGCTTGSDGLCYCEDCQRDVCEDCMGYCGVCDQSCCHSCLERDSESKVNCCPGCRETCGQCGRIVDSNHFDSESLLCPQCLEARPTSEEEEFNAKESSNDQTNQQSDQRGSASPAPAAAA